MDLTFRPRVFFRHLFLAAWPFWLGVAGMVFTWILAGVFSPSRRVTVQTTAFLLQLLSVAVLLLGIGRTRAAFHLEPLRVRFVGYLRGFSAAFQPPTLHQLSGSVSASSASARAFGRAIPGNLKDRPLGERVERLEKELEELWEHSSSRLQVLEDRLGQVRELSEATTTGLAKRLAKLEKHLEVVMAGGSDLQLIGLSWLIIGLIGASYPDAIARVLATVGFG